ncbi:MAG: class I SAM-dependent methyltransferase [Peptostreptococcaceae bacterium]|nr:class I SAM-dependent methyltransferase [Peptostreptococcaceae bacterium]
MDKIKIEKNTVQETLIIPLYARKLCTLAFPRLFEDPAALELIERLDYDFSKVEKQSGSLMYMFGALEVAMRQKDLAWEVRDYLKLHPEAAVVNLGCGLDQTGRNCDNGSCRIYNIDLPEVIRLRDRLLPAGEREISLAADLNDWSWFDKIDSSGGAVFFAAGVFYYFRKTEAKKLIAAMSRHFPGARLVFDSCGKLGLKMMLKTWIKQAEIQDVGTYFYIDDAKRDLHCLSSEMEISSRGYMLGYYSLDDPNIPRIHRFLAKLGDGPIKMKIVRIDFGK